MILFHKRDETISQKANKKTNKYCTNDDKYIFKNISLKNKFIHFKSIISDCTEGIILESSDTSSDTTNDYENNKQRTLFNQIDTLNRLKKM
jgi:hypothetical protein